MNVRILLTPILVVAVVLVAGVIACGPAVAAGDSVPGGVPAPVITKGKGDRCVADTDVIRREHARLLVHQRDETVRLGIRGGKFSLKECVACHAVPDANGVPISVNAPKQFCRACHDFTAVKITCFECHASRPGAGSGTAKQASLQNPHITSPPPNGTRWQ